MSSHIDVTPDLLAGFLDEAPEYLTALEEGLLAFESCAEDGVIALRDDADAERMNAMFRAAHSLKGVSASLGFHSIRDLTHAMESLFDQLRSHTRALLAQEVQTLFASVDTLRALIGELSQPGDTPVSIEQSLSQVRELLEHPSAPASRPAPQEVAAARAPAPPDPASPPVDADLLQRFVESAVESLDALTNGLLALEKSPGDTRTIHEVFRSAHDIKGSSGAVGCMAIHRVTHDLESVLDRIRRNELPVQPALMNALLGATDWLRSALEAVRAAQRTDVVSGPTDLALRPWLAGETDTEPLSTAPIPPAANRSASADDADAPIELVIEFPDPCPEAAILACILYTRLSGLGDVSSSTPDVFALADDVPLRRVEYRLRTKRSHADIERIVRSYPVSNVSVRRASVQPHAQRGAESASLPRAASGASVAPAAAQPLPAASPIAPARTNAAPPVALSAEAGSRSAGAGKANETLRVDVERLDQLMNLGGELVITKARLAEISRKLATLFTRTNLGFLVDDIAERLSRVCADVAALRNGGDRIGALSDLSEQSQRLLADFETVRGVVRRVHDCRAAMSEFNEAVHGLDRIAEGMQRRIMQTRMVAIGPLFQRFRRVVRDLCKSTGKEVDLVLRGEATELDKRMIDELVDPLTHMIRNSVDHGIEPPDERVARGKPRSGQILMDAFHRGRHICIEVRDDGRGLDVDAIRRKLVERQLATPEAAERMSDHEAMQHVFRPGFSTAAQVTDLSGRGMGMDIVRTKLEAINGAMTLDSHPGVGATFTIQLPLTLAIISALMVRIGRCVYALPLDMAVEILTISRGELQQIQRQPVIHVRDHVVPLAAIEDVLSLRHEEQRTRSLGESALTIVILETQKDRLGLVVDELIGQEDVVIKDVAVNYESVEGIAGASILGDGAVSLILDVAELMNRFSRRGARGGRLGSALSERAQGGD